MSRWWADYRFLPWVWLIGVVATPTSSVSQTLAERFDWPPVFEALYGKGRIVVSDQLTGSETRVSGTGSFHPRSGITPGLRDAKFKVSAGAANDRRALAALIAADFYDRTLAPQNRIFFEKRLLLEELIPMDRERFVQLATDRLIGVPGGSAVESAWWNVRMGVTGQYSRSHQLALINLHIPVDGDRESLGHFCFAIRRRGGDSERDTTFDFRAPWYEDRRPRFTEAPNVHNKLKISAVSSNFYDWLYTQTEYRNCYVKLFFVPITTDQLTILQTIRDRDPVHFAGNFRVGHKNCASLGLLFLDRLYPISEPILAGGGIADKPVPTREKALSRFPDPIPARLETVTELRGRTQTSKSKIHRALPSRGSSDVFRQLRAVPGIN
ncbi:MAG: hypothetical protein AAF236_05375 [Verrucomicrobiota bacterium]